MTLDTDGSSVGNPGHFRGGGVIRDADGCFLAGFYSYYHWSSGTKAETMAVVGGLRLCVRLHCPCVEVESNCQVVV